MRRRSFGVATGLCQLLLVLLVGVTSTSAQDNCILNFIEQPASMDCLIYEKDRIELACTVSSSGLPDSQLSIDPNLLNIRWYFYNGTEHQLMVGVNVTRTGGNLGEAVEVRSTLSISALPSPVPVTNLVQGSYYCRVEVNEQTMLSNSSQSFSALAREEYFQTADICVDGGFTVRENSCAVHSIGEDSATTNPDSFTSPLDFTSSPEEGISTKSSDGGQPTNPPPSSSPDGGSGGGGSPLQVWIYVLVAVAAVFAMIIIILAIMCVGLCLRRSQSTMDSANYNKENGGIQGNFHLSHSSMVNNEMYRGAGMGTEEADFTGTHGTHFTSHSQISDDNYNTLGERDYEVINVKPSCDPSSCDNTQDYHRLQRPSPPAVPTGRNAMFGFSPPNGEFRSMSTLTSQMNGISATCSFQHQKSFNSKPGYSTLPLISSRDPPPPYSGNTESHVYRELENPATTLPAGHFPNGGSIYRSPTSSSPPDSAKYFEHSDSTTELLPPALPARGMTTNRKTSDASLNESLYNPCLGGGAGGQSPHPLEKIPETGTMFPEPPNPTSFPVNEYDYIPTMTDYEKPVASKGKPKKVGENPKTRVSTKSMNYETDPNLELRGNNDDTADCTADSTDMTGGSITGFKLPLADDTTADSSDFTGASDMHFPIGLKQNGTTVSNELPPADFTGGSLPEGCRGSEDDTVVPAAKTSDNPSESSKKNFQINGMCYPDNRRSQSRERRSTSRERRSLSREAPSLSQSSGGGVEDNTNEQCDNNNIINSLPAVVPPPYIIAAGNRIPHSTPPPSSSTTLPQSRPSPYKELDTSSLKAHMNYTKLRVGPGTVV